MSRDVPRLLTIPNDQSADAQSGIEAPRHGFRGDRGSRLEASSRPASLTIAVSREAGGRGSSIAKRVGRLLGWQVYNQELLEYLAQDSFARDSLSEGLPASARAWAEEQIAGLDKRLLVELTPALKDLSRAIIQLAAQGEVILVGRGAGFLLPHESTLHVRIAASEPERIAYMSQWLRLSADKAAELVRTRDRNRIEYVKRLFGQQVTDPAHYDMVLGCGLLGEELCADLVAHAAKSKLATRSKSADDPPEWMLPPNESR